MPITAAWNISTASDYDLQDSEELLTSSALLERNHRPRSSNSETIVVLDDLIQAATSCRAKVTKNERYLAGLGRNRINPRQNMDLINELKDEIDVILNGLDQQYNITE
jgi:hypothetical protein